jgi:MFS family permease
MTAVALPMKRMSALEQFSLSFYWFSNNVLWGAVLTVLVQSQVLHMVPDALKGRAVGVAVGLGSIAGIVVPPLMGAWSDRARAKMGRRRPFMLIGTALNVLGLVGLAYFPFLSANPVLGFTLAFWLFVLAYFVTNAASNFATAPFAALMPDMVPADQRGAASSWLGFMTILGTGVGVEAASLIVSNSVPLAQYQGQIFTVYAIIGVLLIVGVLITVWGTPEQPLTEAPKPFQWSEFLLGLVRPFQSADFAWVVITRLLVMMGILSINNDLEFYLRDVVKDFSLFGVTVASSETGALGNVLVLLLLFAVIGSIASGRLSDKYGRKRMVYLSGGLMAVVAAGLMVTHTYLATLVIGALFGLGYGAYTSVDWALATDVLPNMDDAAKDMGLWHIALTLPQLLAVPVAGVLLDIGQQAGLARGLPNLGYAFVFGTAILYFVLGTVFVSRVKKAR